ncbi:hypothetical protein AB0D40_41555 [Streptomyces massasporeus]|uniref:hypothetical protein n=1 Tax=Streptomyces massasporeus TaxID=67324 RepID=UPI0034038D8B
MSDLYELQLTLDVHDSLPDPGLVLLGWHLGERGEESQDSDAYPLLSARGPPSGSGELSSDT